MIHNTYLIRISTKKILASTQYWPVDIRQEVIEEFVSTREDLRTEHDEIGELALVVGDHKFHAKDVVTDTLLVFVTDRGEDESAIFEKVDVCRQLLKRVLAKSGLETVIEKYDRLVEPSVITRLKIALVGEGGVGKTTTLHLLLGDTPPLQYVPTIALNLETVENIHFGNYSLVLWDFAGQERFRTLWRFYFHGADVIFLVCDSTLRNVIISKDILKLIKRDAPKVPVFAMANKQDKPNAMKPEVVQKILGIPTYPMVAIDKARRDEMLRILMTAAAQFVGVALPDLPASELLRFTDTATEEAISETSALDALGQVEEELEAEEEYEEVYVDEEGHIIDDLDEYEIIEEVVEEVFEDDEVEEAEIPEEIVEEEPVIEEVEIKIDKEPIVEEITLEIEEEPEEIVIEPEAIEIPIQEVAADEVEIEIDITQPDEYEVEVSPGVIYDESDIAHEEITQIELSALDDLAEVPETEQIDEPFEFEVVPEPIADIVSEGDGDVSIEMEADEPISLMTQPDEVFASSSDDIIETEVSGSVNDDNVRMAKEIIFEALQADDIISAEIERVSYEELDGALEAMSSDEALPAGDEEEVKPEEIDAESLEELESILGPLDKSVGGSGSSHDEDDEDYLPIDNESLKELSDLLDFVESDDEEY